MKINRLIVALVLAAVIGAGGYGLYRLGIDHATQINGAASNAAHARQHELRHTQGAEHVGLEGVL